MKTSNFIVSAILIAIVSLCGIHQMYAQCALASEPFVIWSTPTALTNYKVLTAGTGISFGGSSTTLVVNNSGCTSVGLSMPSIFSVSGSPVTTTGTLTATLASQSPNLVFASPTSGSGTPTFRALVAADIPSLSGSYLNNSTTQQTGNFNITGNATLGGKVQLQGTSTGYSSLSSGVQGTTIYNYTMPVTTPTVGQVMSVSTVSGSGTVAVALTWQAPCVCSYGSTSPLEITPGHWADYVFQPNYKLPTIQEVEKTVTTEHHLVGMPSESEVLKDGICIGDFQTKLLEKVEELTLYIIQYQKQNDALENKIEHLEKGK